MLKNWQNESTADRVIRLFISLVLAGTATFLFNGVAQAVLYVLSAVAFITGLSGVCLPYKIFGFKTN